MNEIYAHIGQYDNWLRDGDRNSAYFHVSVKDHVRRNSVRLRLADGSLSGNPQVIGGMAVEYFSDLFSSSVHQVDDSLFSDILPVISVEDDAALLCCPTEDEVWQAIKLLNPSSSPGSNGFIGWFYQSC